MATADSATARPGGGVLPFFCLAVGVPLVASGVWTLLRLDWTATDATSGVAAFADVGVPPPDLLSWLLALGELVGGLLLVLGFLARVAPVLVDVGRCLADDDVDCGQVLVSRIDAPRDESGRGDARYGCETWRTGPCGHVGGRAHCDCSCHVLCVDVCGTERRRLWVFTALDVERSVSPDRGVACPTVLVEDS